MLFNLFRSKPEIRFDGVYYYSASNRTPSEKKIAGTWLIKFTKNHDPVTEENIIDEVYILFLENTMDPDIETVKLFYKEANWDEVSGYPPNPIKHTTVKLMDNNVTFDFIQGYSGIFYFDGKIKNNLIVFSLDVESFIQRKRVNVYNNIDFKFYGVYL